MLPTTKPLFNEPAPRQFVPNEEAIFNAIKAQPDDALINISTLIKLQVLPAGVDPLPHLELWGIPVDFKTKASRGFRFLIRKEAVCAALGYSTWVRLGLALDRAAETSVIIPMMRAHGVVMEKSSDKKRLYATRASLLAYLAKQAAPKPAPVPAPAPAPASASDELILNAAEDLLEKMDSFFGSQRILWQEMQLIRKGQEAIMKALEISPAAATPQQPRDAN